MKIAVIVLTIALFIFVLAIFFYEAYNKLILIRRKMDTANESITKLLNDKFNLMKKLYEIIKKNMKKKDYLKDFNTLSKQSLSNYELDNELSNHFKIMLELKEDHKSLNTKECNDLFKQIKIIDQDIIASQKFFNKNNNLLVKNMHGYTKIVAKILNINIKTSYEIKKPDKD